MLKWDVKLQSTNQPTYLAPFPRYIAFDRSKIAIFGYIIVSDLSLKLDAFGYIFVAESLSMSSITFTQCVPEATEFGEMTQNKGHYTVQDYSRSQGQYDFLLLINTNLLPILHRFRDIAFDRSKVTIFGYLSCVQIPRRKGSPGTISVKFSVDVNGYQMT